MLYEYVFCSKTKRQNEGFIHADEYKGLEHPEPLPQTLTLTLEHGAAGLAS